MEEEQHGERGEGGAAAEEEGGAVVAEDDGVVGDADDGEDEQDHDGTQAPERRAEPEDVPRHRDPRRSVHVSPLRPADADAGRLRVAARWGQLEGRGGTTATAASAGREEGVVGRGAGGGFADRRKGEEEERRWSEVESARRSSTPRCHFPLPIPLF